MGKFVALLAVSGCLSCSTNFDYDYFLYWLKICWFADLLENDYWRELPQKRMLQIYWL